MTQSARMILAGLFILMVTIKPLFKTQVDINRSIKPFSFTTYNSIDYWALDSSVNLTLSDGRKLRLDLGRDVLPLMSGATTGNFLFMSPALFAPAVSFERAEMPLKFVLCQSKAFGGAVKVIDFASYGLASAQPVLWRHQSQCP